jgi:hypothetical protein
MACCFAGRGNFAGGISEDFFYWCNAPSPGLRLVISVGIRMVWLLTGQNERNDDIHAPTRYQWCDPHPGKEGTNLRFFTLFGRQNLMRTYAVEFVWNGKDPP